MKKIYNYLLIISIILAIVLGLYCKELVNSISFIGTIYINLLKFMIFPIILSTIAVTIYNSKKNKSKILPKTIITFIIMFLLTFIITSIIVLLINPTSNYSFISTEWGGSITSIKFTDIIVNILPTNIINVIENNSLFPLIIISVLIGLLAHKVEHGENVINVLDGIKNISFKILELIMYITPFAIISLLGGAIANYGTYIIKTGGKYILMAYLCSVIVMLLVMILPVWIIAKINPITYIKKVSKLWLLTITTCSSSATLPTTIKVCNEDLGIPESITNITVPLGCTIHMCGGAVSFALLGIFCSNLYGVPLTITTYLLMMFYSLFINMAAPGIPNGGIVIGATYLSILGIPLTFIGFYSSIYKLLDMAYTTLNVTGDVTANVIITKLSNKSK